MALANKLGIQESAELARLEEKLSKKKAAELFEKGLLDTFEVGTFAGLAKIHKYLFDDIYDFAGQLRTVNIAKGNFRFAPLMYLQTALENIDHMPQSNFELNYRKICGNECSASVSRGKRKKYPHLVRCNAEKRNWTSCGLEPGR